MSGKPTYEELEHRVSELEDEVIQCKAKEEASKESKNEFLSLLENAPNFITITDRNGIVTYINRIQPGLILEEVIGSSVFKYVQPEYHNIVKETIEKVIQTGEPSSFESEAMGPYGSILWYENHLGPIKSENQVIYVAFIATDIAKRKQVEAALKESYDELERRVEKRTIELNEINDQLEQEIKVRRQTEERLKEMVSLVEKSNEFIGLASWDGKIIFINEAGLKLSGLDNLEEARSLTIYDLTPDFSPVRMEKEIYPVMMEAGFMRIDSQLRNQKSGQMIDVEIGGSPLRSEQTGEPIGIIAIIRDITQRKRSENRLRKSEARLAEAQSIAHLGSWDWDISKNVLYWSDEIYRIFGLKPQEFEATYEAFLKTVHPDDKELVNKAVEEALDKKKPYSIDHRILLPDETERIVHEQANVLFDNKQNPIRMYGTVQDITDRKRADQDLIESEERFRFLTTQLITTQERERKRISLDETNHEN